jgi:carbon monoxide dehydrogenase subunit G
MKVTGSAVVHAPPDRVWAAITDPDVLAGVIPGCEGLTALAPDRFRLVVTLGVASIKGSYTGEVSFTDMVAPRPSASPGGLTPGGRAPGGVTSNSGGLTLRASGSGAPGTIDTRVAVTLAGLGDATTRIDYDADAIVGGMVGGVGQRVLAAVAKRTADAFFAAIDRTLTEAPVPAGGPAPVAAEAAGAGGAVGGEGRPGPGRAGVPVAPAAARGRWELAAATVAGAVSMLAGILIGIRIGRARGARRD